MAWEDAQRVVQIMGHRWDIPVLGRLWLGPARDVELRQIGGLAPKVLHETLDRLTARALIVREVVDDRPPGVQYRLTPLGRELTSVIQILDLWGIEHRGQIGTVER